MAKRKVNALGLVGGLVGGAVGGLGAGLLVGLVVNEIGEASRRKREQQRVRDAQLFVLHAIRQVAALFGDGDWVPDVEFDAGCPNAHWNSNLQRICVNTRWALEQYTASCNNRECAWNRIVFLIGHEVGHATDSMLRTGHPWRDENQADLTGGWVLGMLGIHPQHAVDEIVHWHGSETHPPGRQRVDHILEGYRQATGIALALLAA
jgi:F0F1-type ATP synthase membrane subunit c/vacuolar-type H+-ATPase subunit K